MGVVAFSSSLKLGFVEAHTAQHSRFQHIFNVCALKADVKYPILFNSSPTKPILYILVSEIILFLCVRFSIRLRLKWYSLCGGGGDDVDDDEFIESGVCVCVCVSAAINVDRMIEWNSKLSLKGH